MQWLDRVLLVLSFNFEKTEKSIADPTASATVKRVIFSPNKAHLITHIRTRYCKHDTYITCIKF